MKRSRAPLTALAAVPVWMSLASTGLAQEVKPEPKKADAAAQTCCADCGDCCGPATVPVSVQDITARELGAHMRFLASDLMRGRDTASPEIKIAGEYIASRLAGYGAEPAGDVENGKPTYFQKFPLEYLTLHEEGTTLSFSNEVGGVRRSGPALKVNHDFLVSARGLASGGLEAPVVFVGHGDVDEASGTDEFKDRDVKDRFVLVLDGLPERLAKKGDANQRGGGDVQYLFGVRERARQRGALGVLVVPEKGADAGPAGRFRGQMSGGFNRATLQTSRGGPGFPALYLEDSGLAALLQTAGVDSVAELASKPPTGLRLNFTLNAEREIKYDRNVIGLFPGSDPEKAREVVIYSAHYDHVGVDDKGDIFNGSDDNASGTSALLEIAEAVANGTRPARTIAFLWVSGEEKGLLGSKYFADHVSLPEGSKIVADLNLDMVSRNAGDQVGVTPSPKHPDYSTLIPAAQAACQAEGMKAVFDADEYYARTDSYNFAAKGIPVIFFFAGVHEDYHRPTDDVAKADFDKAARIARAAYRLGFQMAQEAEAPHKIKPAPEATESKDKENLPAKAGEAGR